jgi:hypothetical protein
MGREKGKIGLFDYGFGHVETDDDVNCKVINNSVNYYDDSILIFGSVGLKIWVLLLLGISTKFVSVA